MNLEPKVSAYPRVVMIDVRADSMLTGAGSCAVDQLNSSHKDRTVRCCLYTSVFILRPNTEKYMAFDVPRLYMSPVSGHLDP